MSLHFYQRKNFQPGSLVLIRQMNLIIDDLQQQGYTLSVRQLYYQLVARDMVENTIQSYKRVAGLISDARMAGLTRWDAIEDRTREFVQRTHWTSPREIIRNSRDGYHMDMWDNQRCRVFVIVEKEALVGVLQRPCYDLDVPLLAARGYPSVSVMREFVVDMVMPAMQNGQHVQILHMGDHDPSGIDMSRDLEEKIELFSEGYYSDDFTFHRIALNMAQIEEQRPPPNPAKSTDSRFRGYAKKFGHSSWELDALSPRFLDNLVRSHIEAFQDPEAWQDREEVVEALRDEIDDLIPQVSDEDDIEKGLT